MSMRKKVGPTLRKVGALAATRLQGEGASTGSHGSIVTGQTILVIGDSHAKPDQSLDRYVMAGEVARHIKADVVVNIGDWADMESLSSYDRGKLSFEGRRYDKDTAASRAALGAFRGGLAGHQPRLVTTLGNHPHRILKAANENPALAGTLKIEDLGFGAYGWEVVPFLQPIVIGGVAFCHYFPSGVMGRPIGGVNQARSMCTKLHASAIAGHSHLFDYAEMVAVTGRRIQCASVGCFFEHQEDYAGPQVNAMWNRGLFAMRNVRDGEYDHSWARMETLKKGDYNAL